MRLFIEPMEPLLLRTARPFEIGQNTFAESMFPPTPETFQGAIRAAIASYWDGKKNLDAAFADTRLTRLIGERHGYGRFRITGIALGRYLKGESDKIERLFPAPAHIMQIERSIMCAKQIRFVRLQPQLLPGNMRSNLPDGIKHYLNLPATETLSDNEELKPLEHWLTETGLSKALGKEKLQLEEDEIVHTKDIYREEPRLGIGIQLGTKVTEEGYLYQMILIRMNHQLEHDYTYGFVVDVALAPLSANDKPLSDEQVQQTLKLPTTGWLVLGGDRRTAHFRVLPSTSDHIARPARERTLLYLATPAVFNAGWQPSHALPSRPITAALNHYEAIGGWRLNLGDAGGEHKTMRRCVPAGSVYFFDKKVTLTRLFTEDGLEIGYGRTYEGEW